MKVGTSEGRAVLICIVAATACVVLLLLVISMLREFKDDLVQQGQSVAASAQAVQQHMQLRAAPAPLATVSVTYTDIHGNPHTVSITAPADDPTAVSRKLVEQVRAHEERFPRRR